MFWEAIGILLALGLGAFAWFLHVRAVRERRLLERLPEDAASSPAQPAPPPLRSPEPTVPFVQRLVRRSGIPVTPFDLLLFCATMALTGGVLAHEVLQLPFLTFLVGAVFAYLPIFFLGVAATFRIRKLEAQLADAIDLMVAALRAGISVRHCIELVRSEKKGPIRDEFGELASMMEVGIPGHQAFRLWARPLGSKIIDAFSIAMAAKWDIGGNYSDMLKNLADRIRESIRLRRRVQTLTAEAKLTAFFALILPYFLATFLWFVNRDHFDPLWKNPSGINILYVAIMMQLAAVIVIRRMVRGAVG